jgi:hypothetical protein
VRIATQAIRFGHSDSTIRIPIRGMSTTCPTMIATKSTTFTYMAATATRMVS